jgi:hypothetical protein
VLTLKPSKYEGGYLGQCCRSGITFARGFLWVGRQDVGDTPISGNGNQVTLPMTLEVLKIDPAATKVVGSGPLEGDIYHLGDA